MLKQEVAQAVVKDLIQQVSFVEDIFDREFQLNSVKVAVSRIDQSKQQCHLTLQSSGVDLSDEYKKDEPRGKLNMQGTLVFDLQSNSLTLIDVTYRASEIAKGLTRYKIQCRQLVTYELKK